MKIYVPIEITTAEEAEALPDGTHVVVFKAPMISVKTQGKFYDWSAPAFLTPAEVVPCTVLVEHEVHERTVRAQGEIGPDLGGGPVLHTDFGKRQPLHERMVWSTEWTEVP